MYLGSNKMLQSQANMVSLFAALCAVDSRLTGRIFALPARIHFTQLRLHVHDFKASMKTHLRLRVGLETMYLSTAAVALLRWQDGEESCHKQSPHPHVHLCKTHSSIAQWCG